MRVLLSIATAAMLLAGGCNKSEPRQPFSQGALDQALADPGRKADSAADERRKPGELIALAGVAPGDKVLDLIPGPAYANGLQPPFAHRSDTGFKQRKGTSQQPVGKPRDGGCHAQHDPAQNQAFRPIKGVEMDIPP